MRTSKREESQAGVTKTAKRRASNPAQINKDLAQRRGDSPPVGSQDKGAETLQSKRNSAHKHSPDVVTPNWSAEEIASESVYEDETTVKSKIRKGKQTRAANARS